MGKIRTHIIPRQYLCGFTDAQSKIWTYRKGLLEPLHMLPKNTAVENNFYSKDMEVFLANQVENPAVKVIKKIRQRESITQDDKRALTRYIINLMLRVPHAKVRLKKHLPDVSNRVFSPENLNKIIHGRNLSLRQLSEIVALKDKWENDPSKLEELWSSMLSPDGFKQALPTLEAMSWQFLTHDEGHVFITSDNPVFFFTHLGIGKEVSELTFPISQSVALWATWRKESTQDFTPVAREIVAEINRRTVSNVSRDIYSPVRAKWVEGLANPENYEPKRIIALEGSQHIIQPF